MVYTAEKRKHFIRRSISAVILVFFCFFFSTPPKAGALSIEDERLLGKEFLARVAGSFRFVENDTAVQYLRDLGGYLGGFIDNKPFELNFYILNNSDLNAFAAPGGHIFVHVGLILSMESADELAAVLTHEIAHVTARHLAQRIAQHQKLTLGTAAGILAGVLLGGEAAEALITGSVAATIQAQLHYSRNDERHADQLGFDHMLKSGFDPEAMIGILDKIVRSQWEAGPMQRVPTYLRTHPGGPERMSGLDVLIARGAEPASRAGADEFRELFPSFQTVVAAASLPPSNAEETFRKMLSKAVSPGEKSLAHLGLGMALSARAKYRESIEHLESAVAIDGRMLPALIALGDTHRMAGNPRQAIPVLARVMELDPDNPVALYLMGLSHQQMERYGEAIRFFEGLASREFHKDDVFYQLGIAYGRLNELEIQIPKLSCGHPTLRAGPRFRNKFKFSKFK
jgi:beta-barrel assembly-enhancing protease